MYPRQVNTENVCAFMQFGCLQYLLTLKRTVGLQFNCSDSIVWILKEKASCSFARAEVNARGQPRDRNHFPQHAHGVANPVLSRSAGADFHIQEMLLPPLPHVGHSPIARSGRSFAKTHLLLSVLARESAMIRAQRSA